MCSNQWGRYAPIRSRNKIPKKTLIQIGSIGSQFNKPNLFEASSLYLEGNIFNVSDSIHNKISEMDKIYEYYPDLLIPMIFENYTRFPEQPYLDQVNRSFFPY